MTQAFVTDWGGVLMRTVDVRPRMAWERRLGLPPRDLADLFFHSPGWDRAQRGEASLDDAWEQVGQQLELGEREVAALKLDFWAGDRLDADLVALIRSLREQGLHTALLRNHTANLPRLLTDLELDSLFDEVIVSALEGVAKPAPEIYRRALERLEVAPAEAVFVDDRPANVTGARAAGMTGIRFRGTLHLRRALAAAGLPVAVPALAPLPTVRAVIFDWGGVLSPLIFSKHTRTWEQRLGLAEGMLNQVLWGSEWRRLEIGAIPQEAFDDHVARGLGLPDTAAVRRFYQEYYVDDYLDPEVVAWVRALRGRCKVALLTNAFPGHADLLRDRHDFDPCIEFDVYVNSAEVGLAKPDPAIYQLVLDRLETAPGEAIFLDDQVRNTDAAEALGMHALVYEDAATARGDLEALLGYPIPVSTS